LKKLKKIHEAWAAMTKHKMLAYIFTWPPLLPTFPDPQKLLSVFVETPFLTKGC